MQQRTATKSIPAVTSRMLVVRMSLIFKAMIMKLERKANTLS
jgi:hypothetical protein